MICGGSKISKNYAWEYSFFHLIRGLSDGITWFNLSIDSSWYKGDHNPQFSIELILLNLMIFEFRIYNINHSEKTPEVRVECPACKTVAPIRMVKNDS